MYCNSTFAATAKFLLGGTDEIFQFGLRLAQSLCDKETLERARTFFAFPEHFVNFRILGGIRMSFYFFKS